MSGIRLRAPAKVNLHLDIGPARDDGFHELTSIFQTISLYDEIMITPKSRNNNCTIVGAFDCSMKDNTIYRIWELFVRETGITFGLEITVNKRIPQGGGLGGGSSDAAAVLDGLDALFECGMSDECKRALLLEVGSDTAFFIKGGAALVSGRGEIVDHISSRTDYTLLLVVPDFGVSSVKAYGWLDEYRLYNPYESRYTRAGITRMFLEDDPSQWHFFNSFTPVLERRFVFFTETKDMLNEYGADFVSISGSGSTIFGLYRDNSCAENARKKLSSHYDNLFLVVPLDKIPHSVVI